MSDLLTIPEIIRQTMEASGFSSLSEMAEFAERAERAALSHALSGIDERPDGTIVFRRHGMRPNNDG